MQIKRSLLALAACFVLCSTLQAADGPFNTKTLRARLAANPMGDDARKLAGEILKWAGRDSSTPKTEDLDVTWVYPAPRGATEVKVISVDRKRTISLKRVGETDMFVASETFPDGTGFAWQYEVDGRLVPPPASATAKKGQAPRVNQVEVYTTHPDSIANPKNPMGKVTQMPKWTSKIFEGTTRDWWVYVPAQYTAEKPACVMVFQDGLGYLSFVPTVFDNLIAKGEMPVTVAIFIQPGNLALKPNRSFEYDTLSDRYSRFLLEEILPEVEKTTKLRHDAESRAIAGASSGGICAWTVAWERPHEFGKVLSWVGSFTNIASGATGREGGHNYEAMIRKTPPKPIRVFLQDGANDLDNANGNWPLANQQMAKSLDFAKYDYKFVYGQGFHNNKHGKAIFPESLKWLWRDVK